MTKSVVQDSPLKQLPDRVMAARQLTSTGAKASADRKPALQNGEVRLRRPGGECGLEFAARDDFGLDRQLLSLSQAGQSPAKAWLGACLKNGARLCPRPAAVRRKIRCTRKSGHAAAGRGRHSRAPGIFRQAFRCFGFHRGDSILRTSDKQPGQELK